jgi:hypothetical protein
MWSAGKIIWISCKFAAYEQKERKRDSPRCDRGVVGAEGKAIAHIDGKVVFVSNAVPGDRKNRQAPERKSIFIENDQGTHQIRSY